MIYRYVYKRDGGIIFYTNLKVGS